MASATVIFHMDNGSEVTLYVDNGKTATGMQDAFKLGRMISFTSHTGDVRIINTAKAHGMTVTHNAY